MPGPLTYADYARLPEDGPRYELVDGVLELLAPAPGTLHQEILRRLVYQFEQHCREIGKFYFAPIDVILSDTEVRQPDLVFVSIERLHIITERGIAGVPDLVVEILSPSTAKRDKGDKRQTYEKYGVPEYWIVDGANRLMEQYRLMNGRYDFPVLFGEDDVVQSPRLTCISFPLRLLFEN